MNKQLSARLIHRPECGKTKTNIARLHGVLDRGDTIIKVDYEFLYHGFWDEDENGEECLNLFDESSDAKTFSKDAIEQGTIDQNSITMEAEDGQEYLLEVFSTKAVRL
jgi:hypothetical protein